MRPLGIVLLAVLSLGGAQPAVAYQRAVGQRGDAAADDATEFRHEGRTIAEWIGDWDANQFQTNQAAIRALTALGAPAADELTKLIQGRHRHSGFAIQTLAKMGETARPVLPVLLKIAADNKIANPEGWTWNVTIRELLFSEAGNMTWAADQWIPVLSRVAADASESEAGRQRAILSLGKMGAAAEPVLKLLATNDDDETRKYASHALVENSIAAGRSKVDAYQEIIDRDPLDPNVADYLVRMKTRYNAGKIHPPTQRVKALIREKLADAPDAELALTLATIIRNGLANTDLTFSAPSDRGGSDWDREDPAESYATMAEALEIGFAHAPEGSEMAGILGRSLARLRLLQGDWNGMNAVLERVGQQPVPASVRPTLPAPPMDWTNLRRDWQPADASMRSGNCAIEFQFEKDGKGLAGAHVLIKSPPDPQGNKLLGIRADTLLWATHPLEVRPYDPFGYRAPDRAKTRYAVSDATGTIRIEGLPKMPIVVEILIPSSNFAEPGIDWDLVMEVAPGDIRPTWRGDPKSISHTDGPAVVELLEGETVHYPKLIVRPQLLLNVADWSKVDPDNFVLQWQALGADPTVDHYELEMMLTAPNESPNHLPSQRTILSTTQVVPGSEWPIGRMGVAGQRLGPGNIYMFEVRAVDRHGNVTARLPRTRVWVPWAHRETLPPEVGDDPISGVPITDRQWWRSVTRLSDGAEIELPEKIAKYLQGDANRFEYEYVQLGAAWLDCLTGFAETGRPELERLARELPEGNVVRGTARALLRQLDAGQELSKRLEFVADQ